MLTMLFCTAFGSTQQTECVDALSNTENSQYAFKLRYEEKYQLMLRLFLGCLVLIISLKTLLMVCYAHTSETERSIKMADELIDFINSYKITDTTMLRKIYLNIALVYNHLNKPKNVINEYAMKAYQISANTSSWYRAYDLVRGLVPASDDPLSHCLPDEEWYWTNGKYEPWLVTFSHD